MLSIFPKATLSLVAPLIAMFAMSMTFSLYNFALFDTVMHEAWSNTFVTWVYNGCFLACIAGFALLFFKPRLALNKQLVIGGTGFVGACAILLFQSSEQQSMWAIFFILMGGFSVVWHQNVRLVLLEYAEQGEYARIFSFYILAHLTGNAVGGVIYKLLVSNTAVLIAILGCYLVAIAALFFYPVQKTNKIESVPPKPSIAYLSNLLINYRYVWVIAISAGFMGETFFNFFTVYLNQVGLAAELALIGLAAFLVGGIVFKYPSAYMMDRFSLLSAGKLFIAGVIALSSTLLFVANFSALFVILFALVLGGLIGALTITGDTAVTNTLPRERHAEATTLSILIYFVGGLLGNTIVGPMMDYVHAITLPFITIFFAVLMGGGLFITLGKVSSKS